MFGAIFEHNDSVLSLIIIVVWFSIFFCKFVFYDFDIRLSFLYPWLLQIREVDPALGAGLELTADPYGFLIETVDETPGQRRPNWTVS